MKGTSDQLDFNRAESPRALMKYKFYCYLDYYNIVTSLSCNQQKTQVITYNMVGKGY